MDLNCTRLPPFSTIAGPSSILSTCTGCSCWSSEEVFRASPWYSTERTLLLNLERSWFCGIYEFSCLAWFFRAMALTLLALLVVWDEISLWWWWCRLFPAIEAPTPIFNYKAIYKSMYTGLRFNPLDPALDCGVHHCRRTKYNCPTKVFVSSYMRLNSLRQLVRRYFVKGLIPVCRYIRIIAELHHILLVLVLNSLWYTSQTREL